MAVPVGRASAEKQSLGKYCDRPVNRLGPGTLLGVKHCRLVVVVLVLSMNLGIGALHEPWHLWPLLMDIALP